MRNVNVGLVLLSASFVLALVAGIPVDILMDGFPVSIVVLVLGVTYLFGHVNRSGGIDRFIKVAEKLSGNRDWVFPVAIFLLGATVSALGALPGASMAITAPIAMDTAAKKNMNRTLMAIIAILGPIAGGFSPISVWGLIVKDASTDVSLDISLGQLFIVEFIFAAILAVIAFIFYEGWQMFKRRKTSDEHCEDIKNVSSNESISVSKRFSMYEIFSYIALLTFVISVLFLGSDVGLTALLAGVILQLIFQPIDAKVIAVLPWSTILIVVGVLSYVYLLEYLNTLDVIAEGINLIGFPILTLLALMFFTALFSSFESASVAVITFVAPIAFKIVEGMGTGNTLIPLAVVFLTCVVFSTSPYHLGGALAIANVDESFGADNLFKRLLKWQILLVIFLPIVGTLVAVVFI